jgi:hypothetical protein
LAHGYVVWVDPVQALYCGEREFCRTTNNPYTPLELDLRAQQVASDVLETVMAQTHRSLDSTSDDCLANVNQFACATQFPRVPCDSCTPEENYLNECLGDGGAWDRLCNRVFNYRTGIPTANLACNCCRDP